MPFDQDQWVVYRGREGRVVRTPNLREAHLRDRNGDLFVAPLAELVPLTQDKAARNNRGRPVDSDQAKEAQKQAEFKLSVISPLLQLGPARTREAVRKRAQEFGCGVTAVYSWIKQYEQSGDLTSLMRQVRSDYGQTRTAPAVEHIMQRVIDERYLVEERPPMSVVYNHLKIEINQANTTRAEGEPLLATPDFQTFRRRIYGTEERRRISRRHGPRAATQLDPIQAQHSGVRSPLALVEIDHTPLDIILVDSVHRLPMGRPWITLVMDVFSRVVLGFHISLDPPSSFAVGQALAHAVLPKDLWLARHREALSTLLQSVDSDVPVDLSWHCWGKPFKLKTDNAKEFWGKMLKETCLKYNIHHEFRTPGRPQGGAHVERILGTFLREIHTLSGTTFSSVADRGDYDSDGHAVMTIEGIEAWLTAFILGVYHHRVHSSLGVTPMQMWEHGLLEGTADSPAIGLPKRIMGDEAERLKMDFLPCFEGTIQNYGVKKDGLTYINPVLYRYIKAKNPERPGQSRSFIFRYDPRDVSHIFFLDPQTDRYYEIRCRQPTFPSISIWEVRAAKQFAKKRQMKADDDRSILAAYRLMQSLAEAEKGRTREARRNDEKKRQNNKAPKAEGMIAAAKPSQKRPALDLFADLGDIKPFDDIKV